MSDICEKLADWGIELAFIRTKVGREFEVIDSLLTADCASKTTYFTTYGHFDVVGIRAIASLNSPYLVVLHRNVYESAPFRFFADSVTDRNEFERVMTSTPAAVAVMAKIHPLFIAGKGGATRWEVARRIKERLNSAFIFFGLGFSEILIIHADGDLSRLLGTIRELRSLNAKPHSDSPAFSKTTTFPFVSYAVVEQKRRYDLLLGTLEPVVTVSCQPASERAIAAAVQQAGVTTRHVCGKNDLLLSWSKKIEFSELAKFVSNFRLEWDPSNLLMRTTTYIETPVTEGDAEKYEDTSSTYEFIEADEEKALFESLGRVKPHSLRAGLSDLALRLSACLRSPLLTDYYKDMQNTFQYVDNLLGDLNGANEELARSAGVQATRVADAARAAINQRYAGLELHPETLAHSHSPLLCDIRTIVAAATCIPHHVFDKLFEGRTAAEVWPGFVLFGGTYSAQWLDQDVLALPPSSLLTPIEEWWKATHEAAHAVFRLTAVDEALPANWRAHLDESSGDEMSSLQMLGEQFANWFDWRYIFRRATEFYLQMIWRGWLDLPIVWQSKPQYFARSFAVLFAEDTEGLAVISREPKHKGAMPFIQRRWDTFREIVRSVPNMKEFMDDATKEDLSRTFELTYGLYPVVQWFETEFENRCGVSGLSGRIAPDYVNIQEHVETLKSGNVILSPIPDPPRLHLELLKALAGQATSLATEIAYLYSFENAYLTTRKT